MQQRSLPVVQLEQHNPRNRQFRLSLVHSVREPTTSSATIATTEPVQNGPKPEGAKARPSGVTQLQPRRVDGGATNLNLTLTLVHSNKPRSHSTSLESNMTSNRRAKIAKSRAHRRVLLSHNSSVISTSSSGSVRNLGVPDPFE